MSKKQIKSILFEILKQVILIALSATIIFPFYWMVITSLKQSGTEFAFPPQWLPRPVVLENYLVVFTSLPFAKFLYNSLLVAGLSTLGQILTGSLVGFGFAHVRFPGRNVLFLVCLSSIMLPEAVLLVPTFLLFSYMKWVDTFLPLIVPAWFGGRAFYIFLARQFFLGIPSELFDAARIDGASTWRLWWNIALPLSKPMLITMGLLRFLADWNDFMGPLLYLRSMENRTLAVGLYTFLTQYGGEWNYLMAATMTMALPLLAMFLLTQRYFVQGIATTGLAGK
jgi:ABC-type glycerol-3-phosphate transport system permease component